jgi:hypothetical protein
MHFKIREFSFEASTRDKAEEAAGYMAAAFGVPLKLVVVGNDPTLRPHYHEEIEITAEAGDEVDLLAESARPEPAPVSRSGTGKSAGAASAKPASDAGVKAPSK